MSFNSNKRNIFIKSLEPWTFPTSILSFLLGTVLAWKHDGKFDVVKCFLTALVILLTHAAGNFANSYYEAEDRRFFISSTTRRVTLEISAKWAVWSYVLASAAFCCLAVVSEAEFRLEFGLYATGFLTSMLHGGGLKNIVVGDVLACGIFGPLSLVFSYIQQVGTVHRQLSYTWMVTYSLPFMLFTEAIFHSQNTRDLKTDIRAGYRTLAVLVGPQRACYFHTLFMLFPYVIVGLQAATTSLYFGLTLLTLPFAFNLSVACFEGKHFTLPQKIAVLYASFGILYVFSMYLS